MKPLWCWAKAVNSLVKHLKLQCKQVFANISLCLSIARYGGTAGGASDDRYPPERGSYSSERQERGGYDSVSSGGGYGSSDRGYGAPDRYGPPPDRGYGPPPDRSRAAGYGAPSERPYSSGSYSAGGRLNTGGLLI